MSELLEQSHSSPQRFGPYRRVGELGAGAMGAVLEVEHTRTGGRYALKLILPNALDPTTLARFEREAQTMGQLNHPHVARIHAAQLAPPLRYLVLDLYPGGTLKDRLKAGPLPIESAVSIAAKLADGLAHAHAHGILHRDIKPANVLFDEQGQPVLADFGLARGCNAQSLTRTGELLGTPLYMAPEQVIDGKRTGPEADVYALGALLYLMLSGRPPIEAGQTLLGTLERVITAVPPPASEARPEVSSALDLLCRRTLSKEPEERPTAAEFARALQEGPASAQHAASAPAGGRAWLALPVLALAAAAAAGVWLQSSTPPPSPPPAEEAPLEAPQRPLRGQPPPPWIEGLHDTHVTLTISDDRNLLSLLARCEVRPTPQGTWTWSLHPVCVRTWNGSKTSRFVAPPLRGDPAEVYACAQLLSAPLALHFDAKGRLASVDSPGSPALDLTPGSLSELAANLDPRGLRDLADALLATPAARSRALLNGRVALDRAKALVGAVWPLAYGWASLQPVAVATVVGKLGKDKTIEVLGAPGAAPARIHEGLLLATNGLDDPDGASQDPSRTLSEVLELPAEGARLRLQGVRPPFELVGSLTDSGTSTQAYSRPWGTPLGGVREGLPYLELGDDVDGWTAIAWQGGEAWVRSAQLVPYPGRSWAGVITAAKDDPLNVRFAPGDEPLARPRLGSLRHGQVVPIFGVNRTDRYVDMQGGAWIMLPEYGSWCQTTWGAKEAYLRASLPLGDDHEIYVFLVPSGTPSGAGFANGRVPEAPRSSDSPR